MVPERLAKLDRLTLPSGERVFVASSRRARLLGLAFLDEPPVGCALLIPHCSSVHTFGMRFALDIELLGPDGRPLRTARGVPPRRIVWQRGAVAVLERPAQRWHGVPAGDGQVADAIRP